MYACHRPITVFALFLMASCLPAQQLVRDAVQGGSAASSRPGNIISLPNVACFAAMTADAGWEPWVTDGTAAGTHQLRDLVPGRFGSEPQMLCEFRGKVLFRATVPGLGRLLFLTDGTAAGTTMVSGLGINVDSVVRLGNGTLLLNAQNSVLVSDLTAAGTQLLPGMRRFENGIDVGGVSYGTCLSLTGIYELWATDGTVAGSYLIASTGSTSRPVAFTDWGGRIFFQESPLVSPGYISSTNGVAGFSRHVQLPPTLRVPPERMFVRNNQLLFPRNGNLYTSDLTTAGTGALNVPCSDVIDLVEWNGALFFRATDAVSGYELWTTDGTVAGTSQVADLNPGAAGAHPEHLLATANGLLFRARTPAGQRLMRLSGPATIVDLGGIPTDAPYGFAAASSVSGFIPFQNSLLFGGTDSAGTELWQYDGNQPPARLVDINRAGPGLLFDTGVETVAVHDRMYYVAADELHGAELWSSDGTAAGTNQLELTPGASSEFNVADVALARLGDRAAFVSLHQAGITDGTLANTVTVHAGQHSRCKVYRDEIYFLGGDYLFHSDGTALGTVALRFPLFNLGDFEVLPNRIVLLGSYGVYGADGAGVLEQLFSPGADPTLHRISDGKVVITSSNGIHVTDGTLAGTRQLAILGASYRKDATGGGIAYIMATTVLSGAGIWQSDGTLAGTYMAAPVPLGMVVDELVATDRELFVVARTDPLGRELWRLDRQNSQLVLVADFAPGIYSGVLTAAPLGVGDLVLVAAGDAATGIEPYVTDGTPAGTFLLGDIHVGPGSSNPNLLGVANDTVFFLADDGVHGNELWSIPLASTGAAVLQNIGTGCPGAAGYPRLTANAVPRPGTAGFGLDLRSVRGLAPAVLGLANSSAVQTIGGCELLLGGGIISTLRLANLAGQVSFQLPLPSSSQFIGVRFVAQGFAIDLAAPSGFTTSDGVIFIVGN
ncbi:MAG: hypothetical protein KDC98_00985 [Planctomycetes bacterium]|nr:hypothetical protein [Planctomycetota bacterium]